VLASRLSEEHGVIEMNAFTKPVGAEQRRLEAITRWFVTFDDQAIRRNCPSSYHEELLRQADEMDRLDLIDWEAWRDLRRLADQSFMMAVAGADYHALTVTPLRTTALPE